MSVRPPTRSRASRTTTEAPAAVSARAAARPASPAPTTTTSTSCECGAAMGRPYATLARSHASRQSVARGGAPSEHADADDRKRRVGHGGSRHLATLDRRHLDRRGVHPCPGGADLGGAPPAHRARGARVDRGARAARRPSAARADGDSRRAGRGDRQRGPGARLPADLARRERVRARPPHAVRPPDPLACGARDRRGRVPDRGRDHHGHRRRERRVGGQGLGRDHLLPRGLIRQLAGEGHEPAAGQGSAAADRAGAAADRAGRSSRPRPRRSRRSRTPRPRPRRPRLRRRTRFRTQLPDRRPAGDRAPRASGPGTHLSSAGGPCTTTPTRTRTSARTTPGA